MFDALKQDIPELNVEPDRWLKQMMVWHFSEATGSPYWLRRRARLDFDPISDVRTLSDLSRFGLFDKNSLRTALAADLVPRGFRNRPRRIFETGGTTGRPCRIVDITTGTYNVAVYLAMLNFRGLTGGATLAMTPSGPHAYGTFVSRLVDEWVSDAFFIDFDPRWVKRAVRAGSSCDDYVTHLLDQGKHILETQPLTLLFTTSRLLLSFASYLGRPLADYGIRAVCTGGTGCSPEEVRYLTDNYLGGVTWIDTYGNTLMGHALQADSAEGWSKRSYHVLPPQAFIRVVETGDWQKEVAVGERGRVLVNTLLQDLFIPNLLERDTAERTSKHPWFPWNGVRDIASFQEDQSEILAVEGVY